MAGTILNSFVETLYQTNAVKPITTGAAHTYNRSLEKGGVKLCSVGRGGLGKMQSDVRILPA